MISYIKVAAPHSLILIEDELAGVIPDLMGNSTIASTDTCIAIGCMAEDSGETEIVISRNKNDVLPEQKIFDGLLKTPGRKLVVRTTVGETLVELPVPHLETKLIIGANHFSEPDRIVICLL